MTSNEDSQIDIENIAQQVGNIQNSILIQLQRCANDIRSLENGQKQQLQQLITYNQQANTSIMNLSSSLELCQNSLNKHVKQNSDELEHQNQQVRELQFRMNKQNEDSNTVNQKVNKVSDTIKELQQKICQLEKDNDSLKSQINRTDRNVNQIQNIPRGLISAFSGKDIPNGWVLCNGQNGTPNLIDKFIMGSDNYSSNRTGGNPNGMHQLTVNEMPKHSHTINTQVHYRSFQGDNANDKPLKNCEGNPYSLESTSAGNSAPFDIRPPYYTLAYIMKM